MLGISRCFMIVDENVWLICNFIRQISLWNQERLFCHKKVWSQVRGVDYAVRVNSNRLGIILSCSSEIKITLCSPVPVQGMRPYWFIVFLCNYGSERNSTSLPALSIENIETDDLHLVSVRSCKALLLWLVRQEYDYDQQNIWNPDWDTILGSLIWGYYTHIGDSWFESEKTFDMAFIEEG